MKRPSILIVEDEAIVALDLRLQLQDLGYDVVGVAASGEEAIAAVDTLVPQLILMDVRLQGKVDGIEAAHCIRKRHDIPLIFLTSHSDNDTVQRAAHTAPYGYLTKPYQVKELRAGIEVALTKARMERQLREADRWFAHTLRCVTDGVIVTDLEARVRFLNPTAEALTGWSLDEAVERDVGEVVCTAGSDAESSGTDRGSGLVSAVLRSGRPMPVAHGIPIVSRDGATRVVDETAGPVDDDSGRRLGAVLVLRDAAQRLAHEALLRASEARFRSAFDHAPLGMALVSYAGEFIQVNDALCQLLGMTRDELCAFTQTELTAEADRDHEMHRLRDLMRLDVGVVQFEKRYVRPSGEPVWTLVSVSLLRDGGQAACHLYQVHDLTEQKRAAEHLAMLADERMQRKASELANASKTEFLSRVSHEMRTPLNAVMGFAQLLQLQQLTPDPERIGKYAQHIHAAGEHLLALVTDLLDLNRAAQGTLRIENSPVALAPVVADALRLIQGQAAAHGILLDAEIADSLRVLADAQRLRQVLLNLGSNAIKYNRQGGTVRIRAARGEDEAVALTIEDGGIGMTPEQLDRLFHPFDRLGAERTAIPGTGLGLVIARSLVVEMGGTLKVHSTSRTGTTVTVQLRPA
ncbi:PAS domain S-box protein [Ideonella sp. A 288]|uniref:hybrid sensor histidine kinase/response regulator n=1 Tax=Ideonella sp. A 288 TaxID=1962181 RepID=UPI000B4A7CA4|nr:PAS domain S-box protein [Ideonella sp. A 288]